MKILFDILHVAHLNFFKSAIESLKARHDVSAVVRQRGNLVAIAESDLPCSFRVMGAHRTGVRKMVGVWERVVDLKKIVCEMETDVLASCGFYSGIVSRFCRVRSVIFYDDFEYKLNFWPCLLFAHQLVLPEALGVEGRNIIQYNGFKELAYLNRFVPQPKILGEYGVQPGEYIFVRYVAPISMNYRRLDQEEVTQVTNAILNTGMSIIASLERGINLEFEHPNFRKVVEPCPSIHSLIYYSALVVTTGDTVAREGALLGVPTIYLGRREMRINRELVESGQLIIPDPGEVTKEILANLSNRVSRVKPENKKWEDTTEVIVSCIEQQKFTK